MMARLRLLTALILAGMVVGCAEHRPRPLVVKLDTAGVRPSVDTADLAAVLKGAVNDEGFVEMDNFPAVAGRLRRQLKLQAVTGPTVTPGLFPTTEDRLAYWLNARSAWAMELAARLHRDGHAAAAELEAASFPLDGRMMKLADIDKALAKEGGRRAVIAAPCVSLKSSALPGRVFEADTVRAEINSRLIKFVDDPARFVIDVNTRQVLFPPVLWRYRAAIMAEHSRLYGAPQSTFTTAMLPLVTGSAHRRLQDAVGYQCAENHRPGKLAIIE